MLMRSLMLRMLMAYLPEVSLSEIVDKAPSRAWSIRITIS